MPPPRPPSLSYLPPSVSILPPTPPTTPGPDKHPPDNQCSFPSPPPLPKSPMPLNSASRRSPSPQGTGSDWMDDLPSNKLFRSQKQKVGTSAMVSSVLRDWNERNRRLDKVDKTQNKEETKKNWEKAKKGINEDARQTVEKDTEERFEGQEFNNDNVVKK